MRSSVHMAAAEGRPRTAVRSGSRRHPHEAALAPADEEVDFDSAAWLALDTPNVLLQALVLFFGPQDRSVLPGALVHRGIEDLVLLAILEEAELQEPAVWDLQRDGPHARDGALLHFLRLPIAEGPCDVIVVIFAIFKGKRILLLDPLDWRVEGLITAKVDGVLVAKLDVLVRAVPLPLRRIGAVHAHLWRCHLPEPVGYERLHVSHGSQHRLAPEDDVAVGPAEAEGRDVDVALGVAVGVHVVVKDCIEGRLLQVRVELAEVNDGNGACHLHLVHGANQAGHGCAALEVASVRLVGDDQQRCAPLLLDLDLPDSAHLDRISQRRARAMAVPDAGLGRLDVCLAEGLPDHILLRQPVRRRERGGAAVLPALRGPPDGIALLDELAVLQRHPGATVPSHVAARRGVEGEAAADRRRHVGLGAADEWQGREALVDADGDVELDFIDCAV
mmetsp:Transcript_4190/g.13114  ORF Transcript_4190/g.13114 Transcript_4190/m.13114 type:complete len:447 (+) Transcript_4190:82-1422(+)